MSAPATATEAVADSAALAAANVAEPPLTGVIGGGLRGVLLLLAAGGAPASVMPIYFCELYWGFVCGKGRRHE